MSNLKVLIKPCLFPHFNWKQSAPQKGGKVGYAQVSSIQSFPYILQKLSTNIDVCLLLILIMGSQYTWYSLFSFLKPFIVENFHHIQKQRKQYDDPPFIPYPTSVIMGSWLILCYLFPPLTILIPLSDFEAHPRHYIISPVNISIFISGK